MDRSGGDFPAVWRALSERQRRFLLAAYEVDAQLPHSEGLDKVLPPIGWRTVGLMSGVKLGEVDELVGRLAELKLVLVLDAELREMGLICGQELREMMEAERAWRRWRVGAGVFAGLAVMYLAWRVFLQPGWPGAQKAWARVGEWVWFEWWLMGVAVVGVAACVGGLLVDHRAGRMERRLREGLCIRCGYDLRASEGRCPECGMAIARDTERGSKDSARQ